MEKMNILLNASFRDFYIFYKRNEARRPCDIKFLQLLVNSYCSCSKLTLPNTISGKKCKKTKFMTEYGEMKSSMNRKEGLQSPALREKNKN